jgi:nitrite reductase (NO-forming)
LIQLDGTRSRRAAVDRRADRLVAMAGIAIALGFLVLAALTALLPSADRAGLWLPIHLALAGAASAAIAGVMPFFSAAIATSQPVAAPLRWASLAGVALGAAAITYGFTRGAPTLAVVGGLAFIAGVVLVAFTTLVPFRRGLGPKGGVVAVGYAAALMMVVVGAVLATLFLAGWTPIVEAWGQLRPAHAWLNLVGFVSVVIATTLLHFFPTVVGARIQRIPAAYATTLGLALGSALVGLGFAVGSDLVARSGALVALAGAASLAFYAAVVWRTKASWTGDPGWHRFAMGGLVSAIVWFELGILLAAGRVLLDGASPAAVRIDALAAPLIAGWMGLAVLASATHLVPSVGPGDPHEHARQRVLLGTLGGTRLVIADLAVAALTVGLLFDHDGLAAAALVMVGVALGLTAGLVGMAVISGVRNVRSASA